MSPASVAKKRGVPAFTLVEVMVASVIASMVGGAALLLAQTGRQVWGLTDARLASLTDAQRAIDRVSEDLRNACQATLASAEAQLAFRQAPDCEDEDPTITYRYAAGRLTRQVDEEAPVTVASGLSAFSAAHLGNGLVRLRVTAQSNTQAGNATQTVETGVWVQNP